MRSTDLVRCEEVLVKRGGHGRHGLWVINYLIIIADERVNGVSRREVPPGRRPEARFGFPF